MGSSRVTPTVRYAGDKVHRNVLPWLLGNRQSGEDSVGCVSTGFRSTASVTVPYEPFHILPHFLTVVVP